MLLALLLSARAADYDAVATALDEQLFSAWTPNPSSRAAVVVLPPEAAAVTSTPSPQVVAVADALASRMRAGRRFDAITSPGLTTSLLAACRLTAGDLGAFADLRATWSRRARVDVLVWVKGILTGGEPGVDVGISAATTGDKEPIYLAKAVAPF